MYTAGIPVGILVDSKGPRPGALLGAIALGVGYFSIYQGPKAFDLHTHSANTLAAYDHGPGAVSMPWLCFFAFLTGIGGCAAFAGSIKTCETHTCYQSLSHPILF